MDAETRQRLKHEISERQKQKRKEDLRRNRVTDSDLTKSSARHRKARPNKYLRGVDAS